MNMSAPGQTAGEAEPDNSAAIRESTTPTVSTPQIARADSAASLAARGVSGVWWGASGDRNPWPWRRPAAGTTKIIQRMGIVNHAPVDVWDSDWARLRVTRAEPLTSTKMAQVTREAWGRAGEFFIIIYFESVYFYRGWVRSSVVAVWWAGVATGMIAFMMIVYRPSLRRFWFSSTAGLIFVFGLAAGTTGCQLGSTAEQREAARPKPVLVRGGTPDGGVVSNAGRAKEAGASAETPEREPKRTEAGPEDEAVLPVAGLVGQIAGQPIYAHHVLAPLEAELASLGRRQPRATFRTRARALILQRIQGLVQDRLVLDEAERSLTAAERGGLDRFVELQRRDLVRRFGRGSEVLADRTLRTQTGNTLEQTLRDDRERLIVITYRRRSIEPLVNVTRRDVERYYRDHEETFNPPDRRTVRVIYTTR